MAAGNLSRGKRAPDKKNKGKMRKFMIRLNPDISSIGLVALSLLSCGPCSP